MQNLIENHFGKLLIGLGILILVLSTAVTLFEDTSDRVYVVTINCTPVIICTDEAEALRIAGENGTVTELPLAQATPQVIYIPMYMPR